MQHSTTTGQSATLEAIGGLLPPAWERVRRARAQRAARKGHRRRGAQPLPPGWATSAPEPWLQVVLHRVDAGELVKVAGYLAVGLTALLVTAGGKHRFGGRFTYLQLVDAAQRRIGRLSESSVPAALAALEGAGLLQVERYAPSGPIFFRRRPWRKNPVNGYRLVLSPAMHAEYRRLQAFWGESKDNLRSRSTGGGSSLRSSTTTPESLQIPGFDGGGEGHEQGCRDGERPPERASPAPDAPLPPEETRSRALGMLQRLRPGRSRGTPPPPEVRP